ncbi:uncharacterized protein [Temnothorax nylanderi]
MMKVEGYHGISFDGTMEARFNDEADLHNERQSFTEQVFLDITRESSQDAHGCPDSDSLYQFEGSPESFRHLNRYTGASLGHFQRYLHDCMIRSC